MRTRVLATFLVVALTSVLSVRADDPKPQQPAAGDKEDAALEQERLSRQFRDFKSALLELAQRMERSGKREDRERAANLKAALAKEKELLTEMKFAGLIDILRKDKTLSLDEAREAMERSQLVAADIRALLALLMSDNDVAQRKLEIARIKNLIKMLEKIIREEKIVRAGTESGRQDKKDLLPAQKKVTEMTKDVAKAMGDPKEGKPGQPKDGKGKPGSGQPKEGQPKEGEPKEGQPKQGEKKKTPGEENVQTAKRKMEQAEGNLDQNKKPEASKNQDEAIKELEEARKQLEELLRQLREEETQRLLAALQARCERMLAIQIEVYDGTIRVEKNIGQEPDHHATREEEQRSLQLSDREQVIVHEAIEALKLLENEGSAVAFVEAFATVRDDAVMVARRLGKADVAEVTQGIEKDIIDQLREMVEALKKAQKAGGGGGSSSGKPGNKPLIDLLAELKMIRAMQMRVNARTKTYARQYQGEQANEPDIQKELLNLGERQRKISEVTNDIARGKNRVDQ